MSAYLRNGACDYSAVAMRFGVEVILAETWHTTGVRSELENDFSFGADMTHNVVAHSIVCSYKSVARQG